MIMEAEYSNETVVQAPGGGFSKRNRSSIMIIMGITGTLSWIIMFSLGILINSKPYRDSVLNHFDFTNFMLSILTFTPTNIALLCIIAAFAGGCASRLVIGGIPGQSALEGPDAGKDKTESHIYMNENPFGSMLRGLVVYFAFLAGVFVATPTAFTDNSVSPQQYALSAGVVSLIAFIVGYDPTVFRSLLSISGKIKQKP
jgi:hypothetical protein